MTRLETNIDWEDRYEELGNVNSFVVDINIGYHLSTQLSPSEYKRLQLKLRLVEKYARKLAVGMLKGTLKYPTDNWSVEQWMHEQEDEEVDRLNYLLLKQNAINKETT